MEKKLSKSEVYNIFSDGLVNLDLIFFDFLNLAADYPDNKVEIEDMEKGITRFADNFRHLEEEVKKDVKFNTVISKARKIEN